MTCKVKDIGCATTRFSRSFPKPFITDFTAGHGAALEASDGFQMKSGKKVSLRKMIKVDLMDATEKTRAA